MVDDRSPRAGDGRSFPPTDQSLVGFDLDQQGFARRVQRHGNRRSGAHLKTMPQVDTT